MTSNRKPLVVALVAFVWSPYCRRRRTTDREKRSSGNSYYLFTKALHVDDSVVVAVPVTVQMAASETSFVPRS